MATQRVEDLILNLKDPRFFIERFFYIVDKDRNRVPFKFNRVQEEYYGNRSHWDLVLKARKEGLSSLIAAIWTHACLFIPNTRAVVISHEDGATQRLFSKVSYYLENMGIGDLKFKADLDTESKKELSFPATNSSFWIGTAGSRAFGRGDDITHLHCSEVPWWQSQEMLTGVIEACTNNAYRVLESTANGMGEAFHRMWKESKDPNSGSPWKRHFFAWFDDPTYRTSIPHGVKIVWSREELSMKEQYRLDDEQVYWYRQKRASMSDKTKMPAEYPCNDREAFISTGRPVFNLVRLDEMEKEALGASNQPRRGDLVDNGASVDFINNSDAALAVWKMPRLREKFLIGADVAEGVKGGAYSVAKVYNRSSWECVAQWRGHVDPGDFGKILVDLARFYNNAVLVPEMNNHGWATIERIKSENYPHLLNTRDIWGEDAVSEKWGFPTNEKTKNLIISALANAIEGRTITEHDIVTINEMQSLVRDEKGRATVEDGFYDTVMAAAIAVYCLKFFTVDTTYRERDDESAPMIVTSITGTRAGLARTGYR